ncbi:phosphatidylinositol 4-phosphate 5-kinase 4-like [Phalaenopsis equestris]|uniref:phosphatidylinositol 4-phosphate 5-kinase 4-like n=1 Tax=Phalaenopsis equestris TaxID=78828 RepID=UPI0009E1AE5A|nr:phosphatidylinositol 4-phosphate 5-kinase 4-like [Phalaenopsis equestris]
MEVQNSKSKLTRTPSLLLRSQTIRSVHSLPALEEISTDPEEAKPHLSPLSSATSSSLPGYSGHCLVILYLVLLLILILSFIYLREPFPFFWFLSIASSAVVVAFKRSRLSLFRRRKSVKWFIGDEEGDVENSSPKKGESAVSEGIVFYSNGDFYEGEFHGGKCSGNGVYHFFGLGRYEGDWVNGEYDGYGIERWAKGSRYCGQYSHGGRHGFGFYRFYNGDSYAGEWVAGQSNGRGVQSCSDGSCYVGEFKCGVKHGLGFYHFRNGDKYAGEYFGDKIHGFGVYHFANGQCYEGSWHEGRRQGFGTYTFRLGEARSGEWNCGSLKNPLPSADTNVRRAVQSAREASEKAILLPRVEEQVNKAVSMSRRSATAARVAAIKTVQNQMRGR